MCKGLLFIIALTVSPVLGGSAHSPIFQLDTFSVFTRVSTEVFSCVTDQLRGDQVSTSFVCATDQLREGLSSAIFLCDARSPSASSTTFLTDTHNILVDSDGNGLPNIWEFAYFGVLTNTIPIDDDDGDGIDNFSEYISGTNPKNAASVFVVNMSTNAGYLEWYSVLNRLYTVQYTTNLTIPFVDVAGYVDVLGGDDTLYYLNYASDENRFFRVKVRVAE